MPRWDALSPLFSAVPGVLLGQTHGKGALSCHFVRMQCSKLPDVMAEGVACIALSLRGW